MLFPLLLFGQRLEYLLCYVAVKCFKCLHSEFVIKVEFSFMNIESSNSALHAFSVAECMSHSWIKETTVVYTFLCETSLIN